MKIAVIGQEYEQLREGVYADEISVHINKMLSKYLEDYIRISHPKKVACVTNLEPCIGFIYAFLAIDLGLPLVAIIDAINFQSRFTNEYDKELYKEIIGYPDIEVIIHGDGMGDQLKRLNRDRYIILHSDLTIFIGNNNDIKNLINYAREYNKELINISTIDILNIKNYEQAT